MRERLSLSVPSLSVAAATCFLAVGCAGVAPRAAIEPGLPVPDLSSGRGLAPHGSEFRIGARVLYVTAPGEEAEALDQGTGDGFFVVYRREDLGTTEADVSFEVVLERSAHEETGTGRAAEYWRACVGFRWSDTWSSRFEPFLSAGGSYSRIEVSGGDLIAGLGAYGGAGVELLVSRALAVSIEAKLHRFWSSLDDGSGGAVAAVLAFGAGVRF